jgi:hypothetical protein
MAYSFNVILIPYGCNNIHELVGMQRQKCYKCKQPTKKNVFKKSWNYQIQHSSITHPADINSFYFLSITWMHRVDSKKCVNVLASMRCVSQDVDRMLTGCKNQVLKNIFQKSGRLEISRNSGTDQLYNRESIHTNKISRNSIIILVGDVCG